jgi:hypothetical protein
MASQIFRELPPWTLVLKLFQGLGVPTEFPGTFQRETLTFVAIDDLLAELYPYYKPNKAKLYLERELGPKEWITVLRHMCEAHGYELSSKETTRDGKKTVFYTIQRTVASKVPLKIDFS